MSKQNDAVGAKHYKFRDLKVYASTEWLADNKKKYRQVFDRYECGHIFTELTFFNKLFDVEDWTARIELKCFSAKRLHKELCTLTFERKISRYDHIVYVREGWGSKKAGSFWKKGSYYWEAYVQGEKVATKYFYIEETGLKALDVGAYIGLRSFKLYEAPYEDTPKDERVYYKVFPKEDTRYITAELLFDNRLKGKSWYCEVIIKFYNGARQLKGQTVKLVQVDAQQEQVEISINWGSNIKGSWSEDNYTAELIFMDKLIALVPFSVATMGEEGSVQVLLPGQMNGNFLFGASSSTSITDLSQGFEEVFQELNALIGLEGLKKQIRDHADYIQFLQLRRSKGFEENEKIGIHSVFSGNPGTGKTTVAKMMGRLYKAMGFLTKGHVVEVDRVDMVGEYIGQTAPRVKEVIERARGGVLFIDEAYSLARSNDDSKDFGREVIEILIKEMSNGPGDLAVIVAGYPKEMKHFMNSNPGLKSRFKHHFDFPDYLPDELVQIAEQSAKLKGVVFEPSAKDLLDELITEVYRGRDRSFGNARFVHDLVEQAKLRLGLRIMKGENREELPREALEFISLEDVQKLEIKVRKRLPKLPVDEKQLASALKELDALIGMSNIKTEIKEIVGLVRFYREANRDVLNKFNLHTVLVGNPGTGKTTVARILVKIYKALGVLERGHMVETDRQGLVAGFVGQTSIKTAERIEEAMGGVLFIDEAYSLMGGHTGAHSSADFGHEAIQTLLKRMEDYRGEFFVFAAGYPENMDTFLKANPGLKSRFDKFLKFEDYNVEELFQIAETMLQAEKLALDDNATKHLKDYLAFVHSSRDKYFGNARTVRNIINEVVKNQSLRLAALNPADRPSDKLHVITYEDVSSLQLNHDNNLFIKKTIGFGRQESGAK